MRAIKSNEIDKVMNVLCDGTELKRLPSIQKDAKIIPNRSHIKKEKLSRVKDSSSIEERKQEICHFIQVLMGLKFRDDVNLLIMKSRSRQAY